MLPVPAPPLDDGPAPRAARARGRGWSSASSRPGSASCSASRATSDDVLYRTRSSRATSSRSYRRATRRRSPDTPAGTCGVGHEGRPAQSAAASSSCRRRAPSGSSCTTSRSVPESVLVIRNDTLATHDERLADDDVVEIRPRRCREAPGRVKCRRCRAPAVIDVRRHNAGFCARLLHPPLPRAGAAGDRRLRHDPAGRARARRGVGRQGLARPVAAAARARLRRRRPLRRPRDRRVLRRVGRLRARRSRSEHGWPLHRDRPAATTYGFDIPERRARREARAVLARADCRSATCSTRPRSRNGYDVLATGHNLDDEAAVLFGNVLRWEAGYLGRQHPVLPAAPGFARKVKPLVRLGERELAAYCVLTGIDYIVEECPMAVGQPAPRLQGGAQRRSRSARRDRRPRSCSASSSARHDRFARRRGRGARRPAAVPRVRRARRPATSARFCRLQRPRSRRVDPAAGDAAVTGRSSRRATGCCSSTTRSAATSSRSRRAASSTRTPASSTTTT